MAFSGNYHVKADIIARFSREAVVAPLTGSVGTVDDDVLTEIAEGTEAEIDSMLEARYDVPVDTSVTAVASLMKAVAVDMTVYHLHNNRPPVPEATTKKYDDRVAWLTKVAKGTFMLASGKIETGTQARAAPAASVVILSDEDTDRAFTRHSMKNL